MLALRALGGLPCSVSSPFSPLSLSPSTPSQRYSVIKSFHGQVCRLVRHKEAADVLETAYNDYATALQRSELLLEFCGPEYAHFKVGGASHLSV